MGMVARPDTSYIDNLFAQRARQRAKLESEQEKYLYDPANIERILSHFAHSSLPERLGAKIALNAPLDKIEKSIPEDDPRKGLAKAVYLNSEAIIRSNPDLHPADALAKAYSEGLELANRDDNLYKYIRKSNSSWFGLSDKNVAEAPGYQEWKAAQPKPEASYTSPLESFAWGVGGDLAFMGAGALLGSLAGPSGMVAGGWAGRALSAAFKAKKVFDAAGKLNKVATAAKIGRSAAGVGAAAIPLFAISDVTTNAINQTEWAQDRPIKAGAAAIATDFVSGAAAIGASSKLGKAVVNKAGKYFESVEDVIAKPTANNIIKLSVEQEELNRTTQQFDKVLRNVVDAEIDATKSPNLKMEGKKLQDAFDADLYKDKIMQEVAKGVDPDTAEAIALKYMREDSAEKTLSTIEAGKRFAAMQEAKVGKAVKDKLIKNPALSPTQATTQVFDEIRLTQRASQIKLDSEDFGKIPVLEKSPVDQVKLDAEIKSRIAEREAIVRELDTEDTTLLNIGKVKNKELLSRMARIQHEFDRGILTPEEYDRLIRPLEVELKSNPERKKLLDKIPAKMSIFDVSGPKVSSSQWITNAGKALESAVNHVDPAQGIKTWDATISHFITNNTSTASAREFFDVVQKYVNTESYKNMRNKVIDDFISETHDLIYGNRARTIEALSKDISEQAKIENLLAKGGGAEKIVKESELASSYTVGVRPTQSASVSATIDKATKSANFKKNLQNAGWWNKYQTLGKYAGIPALAAAFTAGDAFITREDAEAGSIKVAGALIRQLVEKGGGVKKTQEQLMKEIDALGLSSPQLSADKTNVIKYQKTLNITPSIEDIKKSGPLIKFFDAIASPYVKGSMLFKQWSNPQVILASKTTAAANNTTADEVAVSAILKGFDDNANEVRRVMKPLANKYFVPMQEMYALEHKLDTVNKVLGGKFKDSKQEQLYELAKRIKGRKVTPEDEALIDYMKAQKNEITERLKGYESMKASREAEVLAAHKDLASKYSSSRIALAVEGRGLDSADPWLRRFLTHEEEVAAAKIKNILGNHAERMIEVGQKPIMSKEYVHHAAHPDSDFTKAESAITDILDDSRLGIDMAKYHSRTRESLQMMPDIRYIMQKYLPDSNMRIEIADFWREWEPFMKMARIQGYDGIYNYLQDIRKAFSPTDKFTNWNKWANRVQAFEVARLIALSPSVGFKHAMKVTANVAFGGLGNAMETMPMSVKTAGDLFLQNSLGKHPESLRSQLASAHITTRKLYSIMSDLTPYDFGDKAWDRVINKWNENTNFIINNVELFDRAFSFNSAISMAAKQGMTAEQASYLVFDSILKDNFLSGIHNPSWLRDPKVRLLFLFQGTPFKIAEQRALATVRGMSALGDAKRELLRQLRADVKEGERRMKFGLIKDALFSQKDLNGRSYAGQFMRMALTVGAIIQGGRTIADVDLFDHLMHPPFVKMKEQSAGLAMNPMMSAAYSTTFNPQREEDELWFSEFLGKWIQNKGVPSAVVKMARLSKNDIPEIYRDSPIQYILGVPSYSKDE